MWLVYWFQSIEEKKSYDSILVIIDWFIKMVYYKSIKITINAPELIKVIIDVVMRHHALLNSIVTNRGSLFTSNSSHCSTTSLTSSVGFLLPSIYKLLAKSKYKTVPSKSTSNPLTILSRTIGPSSYRWPSLLIIMPKTQAPTIRLLS